MKPFSTPECPSDVICGILENHWPFVLLYSLVVLVNDENSRRNVPRRHVRRRIVAVPTTPEKQNAKKVISKITWIKSGTPCIIFLSAFNVVGNGRDLIPSFRVSSIAEFSFGKFVRRGTLRRYFASNWFYRACLGTRSANLGAVSVTGTLSNRKVALRCCKTITQRTGYSAVPSDQLLWWRDHRSVPSAHIHPLRTSIVRSSLKHAGPDFWKRANKIPALNVT